MRAGRPAGGRPGPVRRGWTLAPSDPRGSAAPGVIGCTRTGTLTSPGEPRFTGSAASSSRPGPSPPSAGRPWGPPGSRPCSAGWSARMVPRVHRPGRSIENKSSVSEQGLSSRPARDDAQHPTTFARHRASPGESEPAGTRSPIGWTYENGSPRPPRGPFLESPSSRSVCPEVQTRRTTSDHPRRRLAASAEEHDLAAGVPGLDQVPRAGRAPGTRSPALRRLRTQLAQRPAADPYLSDRHARHPGRRSGHPTGRPRCRETLVLRWPELAPNRPWHDRQEDR